jgi:ATPase subunit of ABC transporter with duplicated ATPase domains
MSSKIENFRALGISGQNGCGKTTLVNIILAAEKDYEGKVRITNDSSFNGDLKIGYLDQFPERMLGTTTLNQFLIELIKFNHIEKNTIESFISILSENEIKWNEIKNILPIELPWSTVRLVLLILLTYCDYDLLILDEPTFGFGIEQKLNLLSYLKQILKNKYLILVTHDDVFLNSICDQIITLDRNEKNIAKDLISG